MVELANYLYRALLLLGLAIAPRVFSPDPATPKNVAIALFVPLIVLGGLLAAAYSAKKRLQTLEARVAAGLVWVAVAAALAGAITFSGSRAPLARGAAPVALFVWPALAAVAATLAGTFLGSSFKHKRTGAAALVLAGGLFVHGDAHKNMGGAAFMWKTALDREPANEAAFERVTATLVAQGKLDDANKRAAACLRANPTACPCLVTKATILQRKIVQGRADQYKAESERLVSVASDAAKACPNVTAARAIHAEALAAAGKLDEANAEADEALTMDDDPSRAHAAKATVLLREGKTAEAQAEAAKAQEGSGGRDAKMMLVQLAITNNDLDGAEATLKALQAANPQDADVAYDLALIADKRNKYNDARNGYLATLKLDPTYKDARYNLTVMTHRRGVIEEAKSHARKFAEIAPDDPRVGPLLQLVNGSAPTQAPTQSP